MKAFFSGTDDDDLQESCSNYPDGYLSLIVNYEGTWCAAVGFKATETHISKTMIPEGNTVVEPLVIKNIEAKPYCLSVECSVEFAKSGIQEEEEIQFWLDRIKENKKTSYGGGYPRRYSWNHTDTHYQLYGETAFRRKSDNEIDPDYEIGSSVRYYTEYTPTTNDLIFDKKKRREKETNGQTIYFNELVHDPIIWAVNSYRGEAPLMPAEGLSAAAWYEEFLEAIEKDNSLKLHLKSHMYQNVKKSIDRVKFKSKQNLSQFIDYLERTAMTWKASQEHLTSTMLGAFNVALKEPKDTFGLKTVHVDYVGIYESPFPISKEDFESVKSYKTSYIHNFD